MDVVIDMREGGDWSLDLCYAGLSLNLPLVVDIPYRKKHREWQGVRDGLIEPDWGLERRTLGFVNRGNDVPRDPALIQKDVSRVWLDERIESFDFYRRHFPGKPVVVVAGHDRFWNHSPQFVASLYGDRLQGMLLDNWYPHYANLSFKVRRIGWSTNFNHYWTRPDTVPEKDIDISFIGYNSHPDRARFIDHIEKNWPDLKKHIVLERRPNEMGQFVSKSEYFKIIQRSKIALNLRGAADRGKTMRAYEIPYVGSFMLSQRIDDPGMEQDFQNGVHCRYFSNEEELDCEIDCALATPSIREWAAELGHRRAIGPLSVKQRWADVLQWLEDD